MRQSDVNDIQELKVLKSLLRWVYPRMSAYPRLPT